MRTDDFRPSDNVEDDREASASRGGLSAGGAGGLGIGTIIIIGLISWYFGIDPSVLLNGAADSHRRNDSRSKPARRRRSPPGTPNDPTGKFVALVLGDTEDRWTEIFAAGGQTYHPPKLRLFARSEPTPCALAQSAMGPFYCPRDQRIYLDTSFFDDLQHKFGGCSNSNACKFSEAYVIAHEVGHHVQNQLGILPRVTQMQQASASQRRGEPPASPHRAAGRLSGRRMGEPGAAEAPLPRSRRRRSGAADGLRHRRRPTAKGRRRAMSCRTPSPTALPSSASAGSRTASTQGKVSACDTLSASALVVSILHSRGSGTRSEAQVPLAGTSVDRLRKGVPCPGSMRAKSSSRSRSRC